MNKSHLAAPHRKHFSATAKTMINHQLLNKTETHLDYGCGRGGDVERLRSLGYKSEGYDPYYFPGTVKPADVITMSYVLNVIPDPQERREALLNAWNFTKKRLIVSSNVRGGGIDAGEFTPLGTFSKSYSHIELKAYIQSVLGFEAIKISKDKFLVCRENSNQFTPLYYDEVIKQSETIAASGWVAPMNAVIKGFCWDFKKVPGYDPVDTGIFPGRTRRYRIQSKTKNLPGKNGNLIRCLPIRGGLHSEHMQWAIAAFKRRNKIAEMKFNCIEQVFINEFFGFKKFDFLDYKNIHIYP
ncbi:MAG: methyltransferase domain-containing protein [Rivularia sp. (in: cyanobacteria)]